MKYRGLLLCLLLLLLVISTFGSKLPSFPNNNNNKLLWNRVEKWLNTIGYNSKYQSRIVGGTAVVPGLVYTYIHMCTYLQTYI